MASVCRIQPGMDIPKKGFVFKRSFFFILAATVLSGVFAACAKNPSGPSVPSENVVLSTPVTGPGASLNPVTRREGDWNSGGGYAPNNQFNPWFVKNTKVVHYCIEIDQENFGLDLATARGHLKSAFDFWKQEFAISRQTLHHPRENEKEDARAYLGTQEFREVACSDKADIRIQLGLLTESQKNRINQSENYLALTVRTAYDPVELKGKGFIYFSPVKGPLAPNSKDLGARRWKVGKGANFLLMAIHEVGHVFGQTSSMHPFMRPMIMSYLIEASKRSDIELDSAETTVLRPIGALPSRDQVEKCADTPFRLPVVGEVKCLRLTMSSAQTSPDQAQIEWKLNGEYAVYARIGNLMGALSYRDYEPVYLDQKQKVFNTKVADNFLPTQKMFERQESSGEIQILATANVTEVDRQLINGGQAMSVTIVKDTSSYKITIHRWKDDPNLGHQQSFLEFRR